MSNDAMHWARKTRGVDRNEKSILMVLADIINKSDNYAWPKTNTVGNDLEMDKRRVQRSIRSLQVKDFIRIEADYDPRDGSQTSNKYYLKLNHFFPTDQLSDGSSVSRTLWKDVLNMLGRYLAPDSNNLPDADVWLDKKRGLFWVAAMSPADNNFLENHTEEIAGFFQKRFGNTTRKMPAKIYYRTRTEAGLRPPKQTHKTFPAIQLSILKIYHQDSYRGKTADGAS